MFNINEDLEGRSLEQQIEILWISGITHHDSTMISKILKVPAVKVEEIGTHQEMVRRFMGLTCTAIKTALKQRTALKANVVLAYEQALAEKRNFKNFVKNTWTKGQAV